MILEVSEIFYSIQGEGVTLGKPAVFLRLKGCNFLCGGPGGRWVAEGRATWHCDTESVWRAGEELSHEAIMARITDCAPNKETNAAFLLALTTGQISLVVTGGEPLMEARVPALRDFLTFFSSGTTPFIELETNGSCALPPDFLPLLSQINCSPKLGNSGVDRRFRIVPEAITSLQRHPNAWWKFVVSSEDDVQELLRDYVWALGLPIPRVLLMPAVDALADLPERQRLVNELAKQYGLRATSRLHILAWDKTTGV